MRTRASERAESKRLPSASPRQTVIATSDVQVALDTLNHARGRPGQRIAVSLLRGRGGPLMVATIMLLLTVTVSYIHYHNTRLGDLIGIGSHFARHIGVQDQATSEIGYDGQFFYYLALDPRLIVTCAHNSAACPLDDPAERSERILYPLTAKLLALNQPTLLPYTLFLVNFLAILVTVMLVGQLSVEAGASRWMGAAAGLFSGEALGLLHDVADPYGVMWVVLAIWCLRKNRPLWGALAVAAALLTREQLLLFLPILGLPLLAQRRWLTLAQSVVVAGVPFFSWQVALRLIYGKWALTDSAISASITPIPLAGLWSQRSIGQSGHFLAHAAFVGVPIVIALVIGLVALSRQGLRGTLKDPVPLITVLYCFFMTLTSTAQWNVIVSSSRLAAPGVVLGGVAAANVPRPLRVCMAAVLWILAGALVIALLTPLR